MRKNDYMTIPEAADYVRMSTKELEALISAGNGPPVCHISKDLRRIKRTALNAWMQSLMRAGANQRPLYEDQ